MITVFGWSLRAPSQATRFVVLSALSVSLMVMDHRGQQLAKIRAGLSVAAQPVLYIASLPGRAIDGVTSFFAGERALREANAKLRADNDLLNARLQQFDALEQENNRLRSMLDSAQRLATEAMAAEVLEVSPEPFTRRIVLARGDQHGVRVGQPVIDAHGIMGQITHVGPYTSRATLLTDAGHAIPVLVNRSGLRAVVFGTGDPDTLRLPYLTANADIREGDLLISSGMGGTFPPDYPVAHVAKIVNDPNESFLDIELVPAAQLNHGKQVLLIRPVSKSVSAQPSAPAKSPTPAATAAPPKPAGPAAAPKAAAPAPNRPANAPPAATP